MKRSDDRGSEKLRELNALRKWANKKNKTKKKLIELKNDFDF